MKIDKIKALHIGIILLGIIFISIPVFHSYSWFDEAYSIGMATHSFEEIWTIGGNDVHPVLFYWILHILNLIFGNNIMVYRIFTMLCTALLGIVGYTHIRKDFGDKVGCIFSFLVYFLPINMVYAGEIRMYTLAMLLVSLMAIYAYRIYKNKEDKNIKNWILFAIFSLASAYTHYYGLVAAGIINIMLFIMFIIDCKKEKKMVYGLKPFFISAVVQIALYLPWIISLLLQVSQVSNGFWIGITFPDTLIEFFTFQFTGNLGGSHYVGVTYAILFGLIICAYMIYLYVKNRKEKEENRPAKLAIGIYGLVILAVCVVSLIIWRPIIYARYMLCVTGLFIFFLSYMMAKRGNKYINIGICTISVILSIFVLANLVQTNYDNSNKEPFEYLKGNVQEGDIILHGNDLTSFTIDIIYPENEVYFWNQDDWNIEEAYKAFGKEFNTISELKELEEHIGRIWIINTDVETIEEQLDVNIIEQREFYIKYRDFKYTFALVEKY